MNQYQKTIESLFDYQLEHIEPDMTKLPGGFKPDKKLLNYPLTVKTNLDSNTYDKFIIQLNNALDHNFIEFLKELMKQSNNFEKVSVQGRKDVPTDEIGSYRTTMWSEELAKYFSAIILPNLPSVIKTDNYSPTDCWQDIDATLWQPVQVSPLLRFMEYKNGGKHNTHYDAGFIYPDKIHRTLYSFVAYLTSCQSGATRFINDKQMHIPTNQRNHEDWIEETPLSNVYRSFLPKKGNIILFPHRLAHDVAKYSCNNPKTKRIIIRGDIIFKALDAK